MSNILVMSTSISTLTILSSPILGGCLSFKYFELSTWTILQFFSSEPSLQSSFWSHLLFKINFCLLKRYNYLVLISTQSPSSHVNWLLLQYDNVKVVSYGSELHPSPPDTRQVLLPSGYLDIVTLADSPAEFYSSYYNLQMQTNFWPENLSFVMVQNFSLSSQLSFQPEGP